MFSSTECDYTTPRKSNLKRHAKRHTPLTPNLPPKISRHDPFLNIIEPPANDHLLEQLENHEIQTTLEQNSQVRFGITQMTSADTTLPDEIQQFFRNERPWGTDRNLHQIYIQNFPRIHDSETLNRRSRIYLSSIGDGGTSALFPWYGIIRWHPPTRGYQRNLHFYSSIDPL